MRRITALLHPNRIEELPIVVDLIQRNGGTGQATSGWLFASSIDHAYAIDGN